MRLLMKLLMNLQPSDEDEESFVRWNARVIELREHSTGQNSPTTDWDSGCHISFLPLFRFVFWAEFHQQSHQQSAVDEIVDDLHQQHQQLVVQVW